MKISDDFISYLKGKEFNDEFKFKIDSPQIIPERMEYIESLVKDKKVLHIGCLDHLPLIKKRMKKGEWFHSRLSKVAQKCLGIDIEQQGIDFVRSEFGINNIIYGDVSAPEKIPDISSEFWDFAIFADVIEHINNPEFFLSQFMKNYGEQVSRIIISVPNSFRFNNIKAIFKNEETINSDHRFWFSPYTICKIIYQSGLEVEHLEMCQFGQLKEKLKIKEIWKKNLFKKYPLLADTIVVICHQN